eukprot:TRINITY_DN24088_c0_g1_i2.p2 TRINITY_DN24088_c0_g1~~TRINITY_DN24088_c0_g1_i2.p2  ORF type:complete len:442 (+),score=70.03 TRINITY_DN24088_c0_g1_i2:67-1392(+)
MAALRPVSAWAYSAGHFAPCPELSADAALQACACAEWGCCAVTTAGRVLQLAFRGESDPGAEAPLRPVELPWAAGTVGCGRSGFVAALRVGGGAVCTWVVGYEASADEGALASLGRDGDPAQPAEAGGLPSGEPVTQLATGEDFALAITAGDRAFGWGCNDSGQLALGRPGVAERCAVPVPALSGLGIRRIACGGAFGVAETASGALFGWGSGHRNFFVGADQPSPKPLCAEQDGCPVAFPLRALVAGGRHAAAIDAQGAVWCWGVLDPRVAVLRAHLPDEERAVALAAGGYPHMVALTESGELWDCSSSIRCINVSERNPDLPQELSPCGGCSARHIYLVPLQSSSVLCVLGRVFSAAEAALPLCDAGVTAEIEVELLPTWASVLAGSGGGRPAEEGPLVIFVRAPSLGLSEPLCVEVAPDATIGGLAALAGLRIGGAQA